MAGLCGWIDHKQDGQAPNIVSMAGTLGRFDGAVAQTQGAAWCQLAAAGLAPTPFAGEDNSFLIAFAGVPGFPDRELADVARQRGLIAALAAGYRRWRDDLAKHLTGQYSISVIDREQRSLYLAVDRFATHPIVFRSTAGGLMFGSTLDALVQGSDKDLELDPQAIFSYVYFHVIPGPDTVYAGVRRLLAGESLTFQNEKLALQTYWVPVFREQEKAPFTELKQGFIDALRNAVKTTSESEACGCFLSGGTDSSTIAGLLGEVSGAPARTYSIGFEAAGYDEMEYARIAAKQFKTDHHEYYVTPADVAEAIPRIAQVYDQPFGNSSAVPTFFCARFAQQDGIRKLLGGDGGDELFGGNERYAKQHVFAHYDRVPGFLKSLLEPVLFNVPGMDNIAPLRKVKSYVEQAKVSMPARLETYNLLDRFGIAKVFSADFLARVRPDQPIEHLSSVYHGTKAGTQLNRMLALDFKITLTDNDLPKVSRMCEL
ncbi:MAG: asparagine synthase-related protein, partial [Burkholderiales bacterium]